MPIKKIEVEKKLWGETRFVRRSHNNLLFHASIKAGGYSSKHFHERRINDFYVVSGTLLIRTYVNPDMGVLETFRLEPGMSVSVAPQVWHAFYALTDVELIETYAARNPLDLSRDDIVRHDEGGLDETPQAS